MRRGDLIKGMEETQMIFVTGGAGFIGSNFVLEWLKQRHAEPVLVIDKLTYAGNRDNLNSCNGEIGFKFVHGDICDYESSLSLLNEYQPRAVLHFAAESHVDRSVHGPRDFIWTNVLGTFELLEAVRRYWSSLGNRDSFRFLHVSTDEVYGSLGPNDSPFSETTPYAPNSPYAASKAGSDHVVRAYHHTYGLPTLAVNCSNNYGPYQFPEKLIPLMILNAIEGKALPVYGDGLNVRDWLFVSDHCAAIRRVLQAGRIGETYNVGARSERSNIDVVRSICRILDNLLPKRSGCYGDQIEFVKDRPGHDRRYAIDPSKIERELGWTPSESFETGLHRTVCWYLENMGWVNGVRDGRYRDWVKANYDHRGS